MNFWEGFVLGYIVVMVAAAFVRGEIAERRCRSIRLPPGTPPLASTFDTSMPTREDGAA